MKNTTWNVKPSETMSAEPFNLDVPETHAELVEWCGGGDVGEAVVDSHALRSMKVDFFGQVRAHRKTTKNHVALSAAKTVEIMKKYRPTLGRVSQSPPEKQASDFSKMSIDQQAEYLKLIGVTAPPAKAEIKKAA